VNRVGVAEQQYRPRVFIICAERLDAKMFAVTIAQDAREITDHSRLAQGGFEQIDDPAAAFQVARRRFALDERAGQRDHIALAPREVVEQPVGRVPVESVGLGC
jgi:hypothetical protein